MSKQGPKGTNSMYSKLGEAYGLGVQAISEPAWQALTTGNWKLLKDAIDAFYEKQSDQSAKIRIMKDDIPKIRRLMKDEPN